jgi:hypothetical protein
MLCEDGYGIVFFPSNICGDDLNTDKAIVETCVLSHCIASVAALTIANPLLLRYPATSSKDLFFYCCVHFEVFMASTVTAWGKHATIFIMLRIQGMRNIWY